MPETADSPVLERARGYVALGVVRRGLRHVVADLRQSGSGRLLFPAVGVGAALEAVIVNTGGGLTGGDRFDVAVSVAPQARVVATTQACEKIYRSDGSDAEVGTWLSVAAESRLAWLPQETILFDRARLKRKLVIEMAGNAEVLAMEAVLLGRKASGESLTQGLFRDSWRVIRDGVLIFAEEVAMEGDLAARLGARAALGGAAAYASVVLAAPDAESRLEIARDVLNNEAVEAGVSTFDGLCLARLIAQDGAALRRTLIALLGVLGAELPRVWHT